jgi:amino acid transporter
VAGTATVADDVDDVLVSEFGYRPALRRRLSGWSAFGIAFSTISITSGIFLNFQFGFAELGPAQLWAWPVAAAGQLLVALVVADLAGRMPLAGANYQWSRRLIGPGYGWTVGALGVMYGVVGLPGIALLAGSPLLQYALRLDGANARTTLAIAIGFVSVAYLVNLVSVQLAARVNNVAVVCEVAGTVVVAAVLVILWAAHAKPSAHGVGFLTSSSHPPGQAFWYAAVLASLTGVYTIVGFESAADMGEETVGARRAVPRAIVGSVVTAAVLGFLVLAGFTLAVPDSGQSVSAGGLPAIFQYWLGVDAARAVVGVVVFAMFGLTVAGGAANARLLFALGRDGQLPASTALAAVRGRRGTPVAALAASWALCVAVMLYGYASGHAFTTLVAATALVPFLVYLLTVAAYLARRRALAGAGGGVRLGRFRGPVAWAALVWVVAAALALALPAESRDADYYVAGGLALAGAWWLVRSLSTGRRRPAVEEV